MTVVRERDNCFGVYASVVQTGYVQLWNDVYLEEEE